MPRTALTQFAAERVRPADRTLIYWDASVIRLRAAGQLLGRKTLIAQYRVKGGKEVVETLGVLPVLTVDEALNRARQSLDLAWRGIHPVKERERAAAAKADRKTQRVAAPMRFLRRLGLSAEELIVERPCLSLIATLHEIGGADATSEFSHLVRSRNPWGRALGSAAIAEPMVAGCTRYVWVVPLKQPPQERQQEREV
ncbi:MAG: hypothetical protein J2P48_20125 [Alphaproteobacteria bacterium]|nr:hypothetical protein [Alphaproteobacteria bacterium]